MHGIMEDDQVVLVKTPAWHKLGIVVNEPPTINEAIQMANLGWEVETQPLFLGDGRQAYDGNAVVRKDTNKILGVVGPKFTPLQNTDAFSVYNPLVENKLVNIETCGSLFNGRKVWILGKVNGGTTHTADIVQGDTVELYVLLSNTHDGTAAVRFGFTPVRVVCNNTLKMSINNAASKLIRVIHSTNVKSNVENLRDVMNMAAGEFIASAEVYRSLAKKQINAADLAKYIRIVFDIADDKTKSKALTEVTAAFENKENTLPGMKGSGWAAYNAVTDYINHTQGRNEENRLNSLWFGINSQRNQLALDTAVDMWLKAA
jgi:phage/plasmid-like protein (TIGR03299 family)